MKTANILLEDNCEVVVGEFGFALLLDHRDSHGRTKVSGTIGEQTLICWPNLEDGFGNILLELIYGLRPLEFQNSTNTIKELFLTG